MFRWKGIIFLVVLIGIVVALSLIFTDRWLENKIETVGSGIAGAKVEVDNLDFSFTSLKIHWDRLQVTDRHNTMKNIIETGMCEFDMEFWPLLSKKVIIENFALTGLRTNTDRQTDGKIEQPKKEASKEPGFIERTADRLQEQVRAGATSQFASLQQKINVDSIMALLQIQSVAQITALQQELTQSYTTWSNNLTHLNYADDLKRLDTQVKTIDVNQIKTADDVKSALASVDKVRKSLDSLNKSIQGTRTDLTANLTGARQRLGQVDDWVRNDYQRAMALAKIPEINMQNIGKMLFGARLVNQINTYLGYVGTARSYAGKFKSDKPEKQAPPRLKGQNIYFYNRNARPDFWIKNIILTGQTNDGINLKGQVQDIVSDQRQIGKPTDIRLEGSKENAGSISFSGILNYLQDQPAEQFNLKYSGFSLANTQISQSNLLPNKIQKGSGRVEANLVLSGDQIDGRIKFVGSNLVFDFGDQGPAKNKFDEIVQSIVHSIDLIDLVAKIKGTTDNLDFSINSNLDDLFVNKTKDILNKEVNDAKEKIKNKINAEVQKNRQQLENLVKEKESQLNAEIQKYEQLLNEQHNALEAKKKEIEKMLTKEKGKVEQQLKNLIKIK